MNSDNSERTSENHLDQPYRQSSNKKDSYQFSQTLQDYPETEQNLATGLNCDENQTEMEEDKEDNMYTNLSQEQYYPKSTMTNKQYHTQNIHQSFLQKANLLSNSRDHHLSQFSNSFNETGSSFDLRPERTCKSSTRMANNTLNKSVAHPQVQASAVQAGDPNARGLASGSLTRKNGGFAGYMKQKQHPHQQIQNNYQQRLLSQIQRANTMSSFDVKRPAQAGQDLSNRSLVQTPGGQAILNNSYAMNQYLQGTQIKSNTPVPVNGIAQAAQSVILSAGSVMNPRNGGAALNSSTVDPYAYLRYQQQKYKSCRSMIYNKNQKQAQNHFARQQSNIFNNSGSYVDQKKGNQTTKSYVRSNSSTGSAHNSSSTALTGGVVKTLGEVKNPQFFISFRFTDRKVTELKEICLFKNLTDLDISGNLLQDEVHELRQLYFLKKLNLSNNTIQEIYQLPVNLEILNLSYNSIKKLNPDVTSQLKNITTLDISNNCIESITGIQSMRRLKRLLCKNNQIQELAPLKEITSLVEADFESNPVSSFDSLLKVLLNKKDILVINLKSSPMMLTIQSYDQFLTEVAQSTGVEMENEIETLKNKLKFFYNGSLFRSKRVFSKIRTVQQTSKRSSSNFSNGSSSCGRGGQQNATAANNGLSPLVANLATTPNQHVSQRNEDIQLLYDEILDEEEELERKLNRIRRKKQRKEMGEAEKQDDQSDDFDDDDDLEDDESLFEEEDFNHQIMSGEEDIDYLQSYRNHQNQEGKAPNELLNESTADFNKQIRQIHQELREELGGGVDLTEDIQSLHSTQTLNSNQTKKHQISFKLDLSKCKRQQSEDHDDSGTEDESQFEIPGLQHIKVTEDSFRQMQKGPSFQNSKRSQVDQPPKLKEQPKPASNHIVIPKLQLGMLQKGTGQSLQQSHKHLQLSSKQNKIDSGKSKQSQKQDEVKEVTHQIPPISTSNRNTQQLGVKGSMNMLAEKYYKESMELKEELKQLKQTVEDIKEKINYRPELPPLSTYIQSKFERVAVLEDEKSRLSLIIEDLQSQCQSLSQHKQDSLFKLDRELEHQRAEYEAKDLKSKSISDQLQTQVKTLCSENQRLKEVIEEAQRKLPREQSNFDFHKVKDVPSKEGPPAQDYDQFKSETGTDFFYHQQSSIDSAEREEQPLNNEVENLNRRTKKQIICDVQKNTKRPQSVASVGRKGSQFSKLHGYMTNSNECHSDLLNEYGEAPNNKVERKKLSLTMNKKVGSYIEKLKERNSSLQERLNVSLNPKGPVLNTSKLDLNLTYQDQFKAKQQTVLSSKNCQDFQNHKIPLRRKVPSSCSNKGSCSNVLSFVPRQDKELVVQENEYCSNSNAQTQQPNTQRFMSKKIKFNSLLNASKDNDNKAKNEYSLNLGAIKQGEEPLASTQSDVNPAAGSVKTNIHSFRGIGRKANALKTSHASNSFTLRNQRHI